VVDPSVDHDSSVARAGAALDQHSVVRELPRQCPGRISPNSAVAECRVPQERPPPAFFREFGWRRRTCRIPSGRRQRGSSRWCPPGRRGPPVRCGSSSARRLPGVVRWPPRASPRGEWLRVLHPKPAIRGGDSLVPTHRSDYCGDVRSANTEWCGHVEENGGPRTTVAGDDTWWTNRECPWLIASNCGHPCPRTGGDGSAEWEYGSAEQARGDRNHPLCPLC